MGEDNCGSPRLSGFTDQYLGVAVNHSCRCQPDHLGYLWCFWDKLLNGQELLFQQRCIMPKFSFRTLVDVGQSGFTLARDPSQSFQDNFTRMLHKRRQGLIAPCQAEFRLLQGWGPLQGERNPADFQVHAGSLSN